MRIIACYMFCLFAVASSHSQIVVFNTSDSLYYLNNGSLCGISSGGILCTQGSGSIYSTAIHKDTLYILTGNSSLYRMKLGEPQSCTFLTKFPINDPWGQGNCTVNSLTTDKNGILYGGDGITGEISVYNPYTNSMRILGRLGVFPAGDMMFYKDKLFVATSGQGIYEVNIEDVSQSQQYMSTGNYSFFGLISVPYDCEKNKYYGLAWTGSGTDLVELDFDNKTIGTAACNLTQSVYDAASNVDDGNTIGVTISSLQVDAACENNTLGNVQVLASTASPGAMTYVLDGSITNNTGYFNGVAEGQHTIRITNTRSCFKDSVFTVYRGLLPVSMTMVEAVSCDQNNGSITVHATSGYGPLEYKIDQQSFQSNPVFNNLAGGTHRITIRDNNSCVKDTTVFLGYQNKPTYFSGFTIQPTICESKTGGVVISLPGTTNPADVTVSVNNGTPQRDLSVRNLDEGVYTLSLFYKNGCRYDTAVQIVKLLNPPPTVDISSTDQQCLINNGSIRLSITGANSPYLVNFNQTSYKASTVYQNLAPGSYFISIQDKNTCTVDTVADIKPYVVTPHTKDVQTVDPTCTHPYGGEISMRIAGSQSPYSFRLNNKVYANGATINNLRHGNHVIEILNRENCVIGIDTVRLGLELAPECDLVFVPNAFTPNNDGLNDVLIPYLGAGVYECQFAVYNRWGQLMYMTREIGSGWNGTYSGSRQPPGGYVWTLSYKTLSSPTKKLIKGTLILVR